MNYKSTKLSQISNSLFLSLIIFLLSFLWINFYLKNLKNSVICSTIIVIAFLIIYIPLTIKSNKDNKEVTLKNEKKTYYKNQLLFSNDNLILNFILKLYKYNTIDKISSNHYYLKEFNKDIFLYYHQDTISLNDLYYIFKTSKSDEIEIFTITNPEINITIKDKIVNYIDYDSLLEKCKEDNLYFDNNIIIQKNNKYSLKDILCIVFCKNRTKNYIWLGTIILFSSIFTPYNIYYIIFSSCLYLLAIFSRFNKKFNK